MCVLASCCGECGSVIPPHVLSSVLPQCPYVYAFVMACSSPDVPPPSCPPFPFLSLCPLQEVTAALARVIDRYSYQFRIASLQSADTLNLKSITTSLTPQGWVKVCGYCTWLYVAQHTHQHVPTHTTHTTAHFAVHPFLCILQVDLEDAPRGGGHRERAYGFSVSRPVDDSSDGSSDEMQNSVDGGSFSSLPRKGPHTATYSAALIDNFYSQIWKVGDSTCMQTHRNLCKAYIWKHWYYFHPLSSTPLPSPPLPSPLLTVLGCADASTGPIPRCVTDGRKACLCSAKEGGAEHSTAVCYLQDYFLHLCPFLPHQEILAYGHDNKVRTPVFTCSSE